LSRNANKQTVPRKLPHVITYEGDGLRHCLFDLLKSNRNVMFLASGQATHNFPTPGNLLAQIAWEVGNKYPPRLFGLGEFLQDLVPTSINLIAQGYHPLVIMNTTDLARNYAGLSAACAANLPITCVLIAGKENGQTWQPAAVNELSVLLTLPSLNIGEPSDTIELRQMLKTALSHEEGPTVIRYIPFEFGKAIVKPNLGPIPGLGKGHMLRQGKEVALVALGDSVQVGLHIVEELEKQGHDAALLEARWARPLDEPLLNAVAHHFRRLITLERGELNGGFGTAILEHFERRNEQEIVVHRVGLGSRESDDVLALCSEVIRFIDVYNEKQGFQLPVVLKRKFSS